MARKGKYSNVLHKAKSRAKHETRRQRKSRLNRWAKYAEAEREKERPPRIKRNGKEIIPKSTKPKV
jgi:hypothetical protein